MQRSQQLVLVVIAIVSVSGCAIRKPFEATVIGAGVDQSKIKSGIIPATVVLGTLEDGSQDAATVSADAANNGKLSFFYSGPTDPPPTELSITPLQLASAKSGPITFDMITPPPKEDITVLAVSWFDANDDGKLDLSSTGESESARVPYKFEKEAKEKAYLTFYNYVVSDDSYRATALSPSVVNYILGEGDVKEWMAVIPEEKLTPPVPEEQ